VLSNRFLRALLATAFGLTLLATPRLEAAENYRILHAFTGKPDGGGLFGDVILGGGDLYGKTSGGGAYGYGTVFELAPGSDGKWTESILHSFCTEPRCEEGAGSFYGVSMDAAGNVFCSWHECSDGEDALAPPILDAAGNLYGTTKEGGVHKAGVAFELEHTAGGWREHVLHSFPASVTDGYTIYGGLVFDVSGNLYGTTLEGGSIGAGTVFELSKRQDGSWKETILYDFPNANLDGGAPAAGLVFDKAGNLYGTATGGGDPSCSCGVVFKMTPQASGNWKYTVLHRFTGKDGYSPQASVILDDKGNLYGTTTEGGPGGYGVVFEITP